MSINCLRDLNKKPFSKLNHNEQIQDAGHEVKLLAIYTLIENNTSRKPLDKIRSKRMSLLALMVGLSILQPCNSWFVSDSISIPSVTSLRGRIVDTVLLTSVNELPNDVSLGLDTECLHGYERDKYANHLHSSSISSVETRDESKR